MKKILIAALLMLSTTPIFAARDALIDHTDKWNLFSRFDLSYTEVDSNGGLMGGLKVGGLLNDRIAVGLAARTVLDSIETESPFLKDIENTDFWYGGLYTEYVFNPDNLVYASIDLTVGSGQLNVKRSAGGEESSTVFVAEPGINVMLNVTETFMLGLGAHYRFIHNVDVRDLDESDVSGIVASVFLRFTEW
ncbi:MAG TPA: hypothetical protein PKC67_14145 [Kiritimatiellia bacterium]|nr:hypothetical protein [Kiritimatiellia bacterium]HMP35476.1 hypothetical protein [Kiritimatiellia bacterium]